MLSLLLCGGCSLLPHREVLADRSLPHQFAEDCSVPLLLRQPDGTFLMQWVRAQKGDWTASPEAIARPRTP